MIATERDIDNTDVETLMVVQYPCQCAANVTVTDAAPARVTGFDEHQPRLFREAAIETVRHETIPSANRGGHQSMPTGNIQFLEVLFFERHSASGIHVT